MSTYTIFDIYPRRPTDIVVVKALCQYSGATFLGYGKNKWERYYMHIYTSEEIFNRVFEPHCKSYTSTTTDVSMQFLLDGFKICDESEDEIIAQLQKEDEFARANEYSILHTGIYGAIRKITNQIDIPIVFPQHLEDYFSNEVEKFIELLGILKFENSSWWWEILDCVAIDSYDEREDPEIAKFLDIVENIRKIIGGK